MAEHDDFGSRLLAEASTVRSIGARRLRDLADLDDFTQDVLLRAFANREQLRDADLLPQWVAAIARNAATASNAQARGVPDAVLELLADDRPTPDARAEGSDRWRRLIEALESLDDDDREILRSRYLDELDYHALQERHGLSYTAVSTRLHRARTALRRRVGVLGVALAGVVGVPRRALSAGSSAAGRGPLVKALLVAAVIHAAVGVGWVGKHAVSRLDRAEDIALVAVATDGKPPGAEGPPRRASSTGAVGFGPGAYLTVDAPELFDAVYDEGVTIEMWVYLDETPAPGQHWVLLGKPGVYATALHKTSDGWYGSTSRHAGGGQDLTDHFTSLDSVIVLGDGRTLAHSAAVVPSAMLPGHWFPVITKLRAHGGSITEQTTVQFEFPGSTGGTSTSGDDRHMLHIRCATSGIYVGGMPESDMGSGHPIGGHRSSMQGWIGQVRVSRGLRVDAGPTALRMEVDSETLALWDFSRETAPGVYEDLSDAQYQMRYVGARRTQPQVELPEIGGGVVPPPPDALIGGRRPKGPEADLEAARYAAYQAKIAAYDAFSWEETPRLRLDGSRSFVLSEGPAELDTLTDEGVTIEWWYGLDDLPQADRTWALLSQHGRYGVEMGISLAKDMPGYPLNDLGDRVILKWLSPTDTGEKFPVMQETYSMEDYHMYLLGEGVHVALYMARAETELGVAVAINTFERFRGPHARYDGDEQEVQGGSGSGSGGGSAALLSARGEPLEIAAANGQGTAFLGWIEGLRISRGRRYPGSSRPRRSPDGSRVPERPHRPDAHTLALWDFAEGPDAAEYHDVTGHGYTIRAVVAE